MKLYYSDITVGKRHLLPAGELTVPETGIVLIVGKNGCGKTLLLKNIFSDPENAERRMEMIDQYNNSILVRISVEENIAMSTDPLRRAETRKRVEALGFGSLLEKRSDRLSGGEKRLVNLLRGFLSDAEILLVDEPTNDLDYRMAERVASLLEDIARDRLLLVVTHDDRMMNLQNSTAYVFEKGKLTGGEKEPGPKADNCSVNAGQSGCPGEDKRLLKKVFSFNFVTVLLLLAFVLFSGYQSTRYGEYLKKETAEEPIRDNQINLYSPLSFSSFGHSNSLLPVSAISIIYTKSSFEQLRILENMMERNSSNLKLFIPDIESTDMFTVYPTEIYDAVDKEYYSPFDWYLEKYYGTSMMTDVVDTEDEFIQPFSLPGTAVKREFDRDAYAVCVEEIRETIRAMGRKPETLCAVVVMKEGYTADDFFESSAFEQIKDSACFVTSNEIGSCLREVLRFKKSYQTMKYVILCGLVLVSCDALFLFLRIKNDKNTVFILKNRQYSYESVLGILEKKENNRGVKLLLWALFAAFEILFFMKISLSVGSMAYLFAVTVIISEWFSLDSHIVRVILQKYYLWSAR